MLREDIKDGMLAFLIGLVVIGSVTIGWGIAENLKTENCPEDQSLEVLSGKIYYRTGGQFWINPYTVEVERTPD